MPKADYDRYEVALMKAHRDAANAQEGRIDDPHAFDCGFAWCVVHDRAFMAWLRKRAKETNNPLFYGHKHWSTGWCFWKPGNYPGQSISIHEIGARAFRDSLVASLGINVECGSRLD